MNKNNINGKIHNKIFLNFKKKFETLFINDSEIDSKVIFKFIIYLMKVVEKQKIDGRGKKEIVLNIIKTILEENKEKIPNPDCIKNFVNYILPNLIDIIVSIDKKEMYIKLENTFNNSCLSI